MKPEEKLETEKMTLKETVAAETVTTDCENIGMASRDLTSNDEDDDGSPEDENFPDVGTNYEILQLIGSGGMSKVYKALNIQTGSFVAIKVLNALLARDKATLKRFEKESKALVELDDSELLNIYGSGLTSDGAPYLVMEFIDGESLADILSKGKIDSKRALSLSMEICSLLSRAHKHGIVHRDIKPSNIMVTNLVSDEADKPIQDFERVEQVRIVDFGIARMVDGTTGNTSSLTQTGAIFGTPTYMSPEQCKPNQEVDHRADIYSFGCLMYELLTGKPPFSGDNPVQVAIQHLNDPPAAFKKTKDKCLQRLEPIVLRCLEKEKLDRYQSTDQLLKDLEKVKRGGKASAFWNPFKTTLKRTTRQTEPNEQESASAVFAFISALLFFACGFASLNCTNLQESQDKYQVIVYLFSFYVVLSLVYIPRFLRRQYRYLQSNNWKMMTRDFCHTHLFAVLFVTGAGLSVLTILTLFSLIEAFKGAFLFTLLSSIVSVVFLVSILLLPFTLVPHLIPDYLSKRMKWLDQVITLKQASLQMLSLVLMGASAFIISCFAWPNVAATIPGFLASGVSLTEAKPVTRALLDAAISLDSANKFAPIAITNFDVKDGNYNDALKVLNKAITNDPKNDSLKFVRAQVNEKLHNIKASFADINTVIAAKAAWQKEQDDLMSKAKKKDEEKETTVAKDYDPNNVRDIRMDQCLALRAKLYIDENRLDDAVKDYTEGLRINPKSSDCFRNRGAVYLAMKEFKLAQDDFYKALISDSDTLDYLRLATLYEAQGDLQTAKDYYRRTIDEATSSEPVAKAVAYKKLNRQDQYEDLMNSKDFYRVKHSQKEVTELANRLFNPDLHILPPSWPDK